MQDKQISLLAAAIQKGDTSALAKGITLVESQLEDDRQYADTLLQTVLSFSGNSLRVGVTGIPGSGKSTLIDRLGIQALDLGYKVAVLTIDPSSEQSGGSILADMTEPLFGRLLRVGLRVALGPEPVSLCIYVRLLVLIFCSSKP